MLQESGCCAVGFAVAEPVDKDIVDKFDAWLDTGMNAGMDYMRNHREIRLDPRLLLDGARTVISLAFNYNPPRKRDESLPMIAAYAFGDDYHDAIRKRLAPVIEKLREEFGGEYRVCIDSAPIMERYWAMKAGIGVLGMNGSVIVGEAGSNVFLAEIVTTLAIEPDSPSADFCERCGKCIDACPTNSLRSDGIIDCRRCLNYLTIEHRGEWTENASVEAMATKEGRATLYGCDRCLSVCPHNLKAPATGIEEFQPRESVLKLTAEEVISMTQEDFSRTFKASPIKRAKLAGLRRNAKSTLY